MLMRLLEIKSIFLLSFCVFSTTHISMVVSSLILLHPPPPLNIQQCVTTIFMGLLRPSAFTVQGEKRYFG